MKNKKGLLVVGGAVIVVAGIILGTNIISKSSCNENPNFPVISGRNEIDDKPIIYLYPEETTKLTVKLGNSESITCSYPIYEEGWEIIAEPDGTLTNLKDGRELYSLYWQGKDCPQAQMDEGFVVRGEDTIKFFEEKLEILGLTEKEAEEFIIYWLPKMQNNKYNFIRFASREEINEYMPLEFSSEPDSLIRILMQYKPLDEYIDVQEQKLETPNREGFIAVEWGGTEMK